VTAAAAPATLSGQPVARVDGADKVSGAMRFLADRVPGGAWFGAAVRSPVAHGRLRALHYDRDFDFSRVVLVRPDEIPGDNVVAFLTRDMPCLAGGELSYVSEPVALVAAPDRETLAAALGAVRVEVDPLPAIVGIDEVAGLAREHPDRLQDLEAFTLEQGDAGAALQASHLVVEGAYVTSPQEHVYLEPQGVIAEPLPDGGVRIAGSMQCPYYVQPAVAAVLGVPPERVRVEQWPTGGAFGGKEDYPSVIAAHAALLALRSGHPIVFAFQRQLDIEATTKRHASFTRLRVGVDASGTFTALDADFLLDGGAFVTLSPVVLSRGAIHLSGPYHFPNVSVRSRAVRTNTVPAGAFRGFGAPQAIFAIESHLDEVADRLGVDPVDLRRRNLLAVGARTATGQVLRESVGIEACLDAVLAASGFTSKRAACEAHNARRTDVARGLGLALFWHGGGFTGSGERKMAPRAALELLPDGRVEILVANTEFGQGSQTALAQIVADACRVPLDRIRYPLPDTARVPNSGPTVASRTTMVVGRIVERCGHALVGRIAAAIDARAEGGGFVRADGTRLDWNAAAALACAGGPLRVELQHEHPPHLHWDDEAHVGDAYAAYSWGAVVAAVSVDRATLEVTCDEVWCAVDVGTVINPREARGQVEGGLTQALGWALIEQVTYDRGGRVRENRLQTYVIPTSADVPPFHVQFVEVPYSGGPFGAKGLGELPMNGLAPALRNAVRHAVGRAPSRLPMTPDTMLQALGDTTQEGTRRGGALAASSGDG
jgi:CO/xanthine dehydrogenase Mo-binding subunit